MAENASFYESAEFQELWRLVNRRYLTWDEFRELPMPTGVTPERVWRAVAALRKGAGTTFDYPPWFPYVEGGSIWFFTPKESQERLQRITERSAQGAHLARSIAKLGGYYFCQYLMLDEFLAACESDGVVVDRQRARRAALHGMEPRDNGERLFANLCAAFTEAEGRYVGRPVTFGLLEDIERDLARGIEDTGLGVVEPFD